MLVSALNIQTLIYRKYCLILLMYSFLSVSPAISTISVYVSLLVMCTFLSFMFKLATCRLLSPPYTLFIVATTCTKSKHCYCFIVTSDKALIVEALNEHDASHAHIDLKAEQLLGVLVPEALKHVSQGISELLPGLLGQL